MAYGDLTQTGVESDVLSGEHSNSTIDLQGGEDRVALPADISAKEAEFSRDGLDLILHNGDHSVTIGNYYAAAEPPLLEGADGTVLSPKLVHSFTNASPEYANSATMNDESPIGAVHEIEGSATITRGDGSSETMKLGTPVYQGDIIETSGDGAVNIMFVDETTLAVSEDARMAIDEYVFDPATSGGVTNLSVLKGVFVYTSGLIGREDPDDVKIETPSGSIGIRGTIIAADVDSGEVTVVEGAIVLTDRAGNEMTLASQYETARFNGAEGSIQNMGQLPANDVAGKYSAVANVSGSLFSSIQDNASVQADPNAQEAEPQQNLDQNNDTQIDGSVDQNGDGSADGSINEPAAAAEEHGDASDVLDAGVETEMAAQDISSSPEQSFTETRFGMSQGLGSSTGLHSSMPATVAVAEPALPASTTIAAPSGAHLQAQAASSSNTKGSTPQNLDTVQQAPSAETAPPSSVTPPPAPVFSVNAVATPIAENMPGNVASLNASNGALSSVVFSGANGHMFEFVSTDAQNGFIRLRSGYNLDHETANTLSVQYSATDAASGASQSGVVNVSVLNLNEAPELLDQTSDYALHSTGNALWEYNFRDDFHDQDMGDILRFTFTVNDASGNFLFDQTTIAPSAIMASSVIFNPDGSASINFNPSATLTGFEIVVTATDAAGLSLSHSYDFNLFTPQATFIPGDSSDSIISSGSIYASLLDDENVNISGSGNRLFFSNNDNSQIFIEGSDNTVYLMNGDDELTLDSAASGNIIAAGNGNDTIHMMNGANSVYGESGADEFVFDMNYDIFAEINTSSSQINGGSDGAESFFINFGNTVQNGVAGLSVTGGGDTIQIGNGTFGGNLDFSMISNLVNNIEFINLNNGQNNALEFSYSDVFQMTDDRNTLFIQGESGDTMTLDTLGRDLRAGPQVTHDESGEVFDVYFVGDVTVLVDTDVTVTTV